MGLLYLKTSSNALREKGKGERKKSKDIAIEQVQVGVFILFPFTVILSPCCSEPFIVTMPHA